MDGVTLHQISKGKICGSFPSKPLKKFRRHKCSICYAALKIRMDEQQRLQKAVLEVNEYHNYSKPACSSPGTNSKGAPGCSPSSINANGMPVCSSFLTDANGGPSCSASRTNANGAPSCSSPRTNAKRGPSCSAPCTNANGAPSGSLPRTNVNGAPSCSLPRTNVNGAPSCSWPRTYGNRAPACSFPLIYGNEAAAFSCPHTYGNGALAYSNPRTNGNGAPFNGAPSLVSELNNVPSTSDDQHICDESHDLQVENDQSPNYPRLNSSKSFSQDWASNKLFKQLKLKDTELNEQNKNKEKEKKCKPKRKRGKGEAKKAEPKRTCNNGKWERKPMAKTIHNIKNRTDRQVLAKLYHKLICCVNGNSSLNKQNKRIAHIRILKMSTDYIKFLTTESWKLELERKWLQKENLLLVEKLQTLQKKNNVS